MIYGSVCFGTEAASVAWENYWLLTEYNNGQMEDAQ